MKRLKSAPSLILLAFILLAVAPFPAASVSADEVETSAVITVNTDVDEDTVNANCSLREAITAANSNAAYKGCTAGSGTDTITFASNYIITLGSQLPDVLSDVILNGSSAGNTIIQASTCNPVTLPGGCTPASYGVFTVANTGTLTINRLTVRHGNTGTWGGGIANGGTVTVTNSTINGNRTGFGGGGIANANTMSIMNSTISGNYSNNSGGGLYNDSTGTLTITNSTISDNGAPTSGGGIYNTGTLHFRNTLVANSTTGGDCVDNGTISTNVNNLVENSLCSAAYSGDPSLGPLATNGGTTQTHALLADSKAINRGTNTGCPSTDQRGKTRPQGAKCDIGAFEFVFPAYKSQGTNDGWILESAENSNAGGTMNSTATTLRLGDDVARKQYRAIISFNTSSLPDNVVITKVTLKVKRQAIVGGGNPVTAFQGFMLDIRKGTFGTSALQLTDWQTAGQKTVGPTTPALTGGWYTLDLTSAKAYINKLTTLNGLTQIRLRFQLDDNNNSIANYLSLYSGNVGAASRPQLIIEYYVP